MASPAPLSVLQVASGLHVWGGIERYVAYLTQALRERGHHVEAVVPPDSPLAQHVPEPLHRGVRRKHDLTALAWYVRLFGRRRFDVVHVHFNPDFLVAGVAAKLRRQPLTILTRHVALPWSRPKVRLYGRLFDHIIPVSDAVRRRLAQSGIPEAHMTVAKAGCPALDSTAPASIGGGPGLFHVGCFGRLAAEKGLDLLFDAAEVAELSRVRFHIFGTGPLEQAFRSKAVPSVSLYGHQPTVSGYIAAMHSVVIPSRWEEAFPYAALEAMSAAKPIIASRIGGLPELVQQGVNGVLFEPGDARDLARSIAMLASDPAAAAAMGKAGQDLHQREYTVARMGERIEAVYLAQTKGPRH